MYENEDYKSLYLGLKKGLVDRVSDVRKQIGEEGNLEKRAMLYLKLVNLNEPLGMMDTAEMALRMFRIREIAKTN